LADASVPQKEVSSVCACLVQGSKTLLSHGIYHLDAKLENMAYLGKGQAKHFDYAQSVNCNNLGWEGEGFSFTPGYALPSEIQDISGSSPKERKTKMERAHIYEMGMSFLLLAGKSKGEGLLAGKSRGEVGQMIYVLKMATGNGMYNDLSDKELTQVLKVYTPKEAACVINMIGSNDKYRPTMTQIERAFPSSSIMS
jgi:hypothetical protein